MMILFHCDAFACAPAWRWWFDDASGFCRQTSGWAEDDDGVLPRWRGLCCRVVERCACSDASGMRALLMRT